MKWTSKHNWERKKKRLESWHRWFAWRPILIDVLADNRKTYIWLGFIWRRGRYCPGWNRGYWDWEYKDE